MIYVYRFNCLECQIKGSVKILRIAPEIWACEQCNFWFERWELRHEKQSNQ
jgi:ribosomal protein L37AE/L43A